MSSLILLADRGTEFSRLPADVRSEIDAWIMWLDRLVKSRPRGVAIEQASEALRVGVSTVRAKLADWERSKRDWRVLINHAKLPRRDARLPDVFIREVKRRFEANSRSQRKAWRDLVSDARSGQPIPGYPLGVEIDSYTGYPPSWSYQNLLKVCKSTSFERTAMTIGLGAAITRHAPKLFTTRAELWPMSHIMFDDVDHDNFVHLGKQLVRVSELGALDVRSGSRFAWGARPQLRRADGSMDKLKEANMRFLLARVLGHYGYHGERGTELVVEHGTATVREDVERLLFDRTGGKVTVRRGGFLGKEQAVPGMFFGSGGGNPRHKSCLESLHSLIHNELAALPAQTGPDLDRRPEELSGLLKHSEELLKIGAQLTPYQRDLLQLPTLEYHREFLPLLRQTHQLIDQRTWHELEGWSEAGFVSDEYRFAPTIDQWIGKRDYLALPPAAQQALTEIIRQNPTCRRPARLSPAAAFSLGRSEVKPSPMSLVAEILYQDLVCEHKTRNGYFEFTDPEVGSDVLRFEARVTTLDGHEQSLVDREIFEVVVNPFDASLLWVYSGRRGRGAFLGVARRDEKVSRADVQGIQRKLARNNALLSEQIAPLAARHTSITRQATCRARHNAAVISGPTSAEEARMNEHRSRVQLSHAELTAIETTSSQQPQPETDNYSDLI